ncbi:Pkinase-domain-containing protein [Sporormia fimetaria CBS 119925]|uniref:non-specific serine/threonine protein kinase n=1 Tax=Sporormia fimetaria CBS 119925 TaxID=1340428 RepID=A0A6A6V8K2_9PLEO|nr:Pkinase-domain-containing protein [Sporormia fimetaria CBS 119925]
MNAAPHARGDRRVLGDATLRANEDVSRRRLDQHVRSAASSPHPGVENLVPSPTGTLPENKRLSAVQDAVRPHNPKRDSEISVASTNASNSGRKRKTHIGPWQLGKTIGRGGCSRVRIVRHSVTSELGAAKIISKTMAETVMVLSLANLAAFAETDPSLLSDGKSIPFGLEREICIMKLLDHPNIVRLHDIWENRNEIYLVMEYVEGGELFHYIAEQGHLRETEVVWLFRQILAALEYCHRLHIHHRDLKPENILLDKQTFQIKLVDFGMAALQPQGQKLTTPCGSPHYAAPEVITSKSYDGAKADIWSCGVILFMMLTGRPPFQFGETDGSDMKPLFRAIARADYQMPDTLSPEAQDLIRRILVPDPRIRITIAGIWSHPFMQKYNTEHGIDTAKSSLEYWAGPKPTLEGWQPLTRDTIDREVFRYLRTLWHSEKEEVLIKRLLSRGPNDEKYFYSALVKYRNDQLEDYTPGMHAVGYSTSDHHHVKRPPPSHKRTKSTLSILNDEHIYSKHSFYGPPSSEASYDPFRASRGPMLPNSGKPKQNVTVHRGSTNGSRYARPATALGHHNTASSLNRQRTASSLRVRAIRNNSTRQSSIMSRPSSKRSTPYSQRTGRRPSRSSLASSYWPSSPPVMSRSVSSLAKRGVSFSHLRTPSTARENARPVQETPTPPSRIAAMPATSPRVARMKMRKPESPTKYIQKEVRKVSTELGRVMEEAFRSSVDSSVTADHRYSTPPTSFSNTRESPGSSLITPQNRWSKRPLPPIPDETPKTFVQRKLAETREDIARRLAITGGDEELGDILHKLDSILHLEPSVLDVGPGQRAASAPTRSPEHVLGLPAIQEFQDDVSGATTRAVTDPVRPNTHGGLNEYHSTIRVVDLSPIAPLNIRKRSTASAVTRAEPAPRKEDNLHTLGVPLIVRPNDSTSFDPMPEENFTHGEHAIKKKKSSWFRREGDEKHQEPPKQEVQKMSSLSRLRIPDAWQGLDDRIDKSLSPARPAVPMKQTVRSDSSEFPIRSCVTTGEKRPVKDRKSFLGLFTKKPKELKAKGSLELGSNFSVSSGSSRSNLPRGLGSGPGQDIQLNWFYRFLNIRPAVKALCLSMGRKRAQQDIINLLRDWQRFGVRDVCQDRESPFSINCRVDKDNHLKIKPVSLVIELFAILDRGRRARLCLVRCTQTKGAASSFRKVTQIIEDVFIGRDMLVKDKSVREDMCALLGL